MAKNSFPMEPKPLDMRNPANKGAWFDSSKTRPEVQPKRHAFDKPSPFGPDAPRQDHQQPVPGIRGGGK